MNICIITGSAGLAGAECVRFFSQHGFRIIGIDNDMRGRFFGPEASTAASRDALLRGIPGYRHFTEDIRNPKAMGQIFSEYAEGIRLIIHAASQPSHDWAATDPETDFSVNAHGTLVLLECARRHAPEAVFLFLSTNKVYGDNPNRLPLQEMKTRWEMASDHPFHTGIDESLSIDQATHSLFGASKASADLMVQEYHRTFGLKTMVFRAGCLTGPDHASVESHGFLSYLMKCAVTGQEYRIHGYKGKQVRDNLHSRDLVQAFHHAYTRPHPGEVYNMGGGRASSCSILEAIPIAEAITGNKMKTRYLEKNRTGDHIWWISDTSKFRRHYPAWRVTHDVRAILEDIQAKNQPLWAP